MYGPPAHVSALPVFVLRLHCYTMGTHISPNGGQRRRAVPGARARIGDTGLRHSHILHGVLLVRGAGSWAAQFILYLFFALFFYYFIIIVIIIIIIIMK